MLERNKRRCSSPSLWLITLVGVIVPRRLRAEWKQEWEAELRYRELLLEEWDKLTWLSKLDLFWRSLGAFRDALWLQQLRWEDDMFQDLRYGTRMLVKNPGFTFVALLTLALGVSANTSIFSVVNALLLRPLPYPNPDQLVWVGEVIPQTKSESVPGHHFLDWSERSQTLERIAAYNPDDFTLTGAGEPERLDGNRVSADFFTLLGVEPLLGRNFLPAEDRPGGERAAIISHSLWQRRFSADRGVVGRSITLDNQSYTVVGVLPPGFRFIHPFEVWVPLALDPQQERGNQQISILSVIARLRPGVTREQARAELETIRSLTRSSERPLPGGQVRLTSLHARLVGDTRRLLLILLGAASLILLIACANIANLLLSRAVARQKELAIRASLGAGRLRLVRQMLTESLLLALGGGALGLLLAFCLTKALVALAAADTFGDISHLATVNLDFRVLGFTLLVSLATGILSGSAPAILLSRPNLNDSLKEGGRSGVFHRSRLRHLLMMTEVALAVVLLAGAGLLIRSFARLLEVNPGYRAEGLLTLRVSLPELRYEQAEKRKAFYHEILQRVSALPGVESAGVINHLPLTDFQLAGWLRIPGRPQPFNANGPGTPMGIVSQDYFRVMGIPLRAGRIFTERDDSESPRVAILSEALARQLFPDEDAVGKKVWMPGPGKDTPTVIGVVGDVKHQGLDRDVTPQAYVPYLQFAMPSTAIVVRTTGNPLRLAAAVRNQALAIDREVPVYEVQTMDERLTASISSRRFNLLLLGVFALLALALAAVGVYGVIAYVVTQRTQEVGIRIALGAQRSDVLRLFIWQGMTSVVIGVALGLAGAWALTRVMASLLFSVSATDPATFAGVALLLTVVALLACYLPARRASRVDPMVALRYE